MKIIDLSIIVFKNNIAKGNDSPDNFLGKIMIE